ncbi:MAG TPA: hemerythrin domain-containing protein [Bryobacteraceae bacterium]|jgi:hypothetical protein|nr:hemerythrin domain-containing protein [Bryobacteraceae bacterium]
MRSIASCLREEHRVLEGRLDALSTAIARGDGIAESLALAAESARRHYLREQPFLGRLALYEPALADKLQSQHEEVSEISARFEEALAEGQPRDMLSLARRFHAIAQHNIIEEERDVFPLADRCLTTQEQEDLLAALASATDDSFC